MHLCFCAFLIIFCLHFLVCIHFLSALQNFQISSIIIIVNLLQQFPCFRCILDFLGAIALEFVFE